MGVRVDGRRRRAAALLNLSGLGAGYVYLGRWGLAVCSWLVSAALVLLATSLRASAAPALWLGVYLVWLALMVRGGWKRGGARASADVARRPKPRPSTPNSPNSPNDTVRVPPADRHPGWRPFVVAGVLLTAVAGGLYVLRDLPREALERAERAHAAGHCAQALEDYDRASHRRYEFTLTSAPDTARYGARSCRLLLTAERANQRHRYAEAIGAYESYLQRSAGRRSWDRAEQRLITARMGRADALAARVATSDTAMEQRYRSAARAYLSVRDHHPGSPEAGELPDRFDALYSAATAPWRDDARPCDVLDDLRALGALADLNRPESTAIARRATSALPDASQQCGRIHHGAGEHPAPVAARRGAPDDPTSVGRRASHHERPPWVPEGR